MSLDKVVEKWVDHFNSGDATAMASLYHANAVKEFSSGKKIEGRVNIQASYESEFLATDMVCIIDQMIDVYDTLTLEWRDPSGFRGCSIFRIIEEQIIHERVYFDELSFLRAHNLPLPKK